MEQIETADRNEWLSQLMAENEKKNIGEEWRKETRAKTLDFNQRLVSDKVSKEKKSKQNKKDPKTPSLGFRLGMFVLTF